MAVFFNSLSGVLIILVMIAVGYVLTRVHWFDDRSSHLIAKLVTQVALPCYMMATIMKDFTRKQLETLLPDLRFPVISMLILFAFSFAAVQIFRIPKTRAGLFKSMFFNSNTVFIGLPVNRALFGDASLPYVLVYYMANTFFFWTLGVYLIKRDGSSDVAFNLWTAIKKVFSPPLFGFILGVIFVILGWHLPTFLMSDLQYIGGLTIPLSMFFIGIQIGIVGLHSFRITKDALGILMGRFVFAPLVMALLVLLTRLPILLKQVFIMQSAMPVMTNAPVVAKLYGADADYAAIMVTESTVISMVIIPILMTITQNIR
ncbi:AEC family transporter [Agrilactobacillus fermenti]|uniref:AEC family transporter n=1 Tax=Agrilactobacillus fermenti TaxID=2586909 RepID=UPI001E535B90|nr:AEC family transporter [Agrilactobacillus fermenti]MCD2255400.1 AEC family transporter [Agrilactobacillus fermenti]